MDTFIITASHNLCGNYCIAYSFQGFAALLPEVSILLECDSASVGNLLQTF